MPSTPILFFAMSDDSIGVMNTWQSSSSPMNCSMQAFPENETTNDRVYVCVTRERAAALAGESIALSQKHQ